MVDSVTVVEGEEEDSGEELVSPLSRITSLWRSSRVARSGQQAVRFPLSEAAGSNERCDGLVGSLKSLHLEQSSRLHDTALPSVDDSN